MDKKLIALVFVALLVGLGGGYGLGYAIYYPQIQNLQNDINNLNDKYYTLNSTIENSQSTIDFLQNALDSLDEKVETIDQNMSSCSLRIDEIEGKTWHIADSEAIEGIAPLTLFSNDFQIRGNWIRIRWIAEASYITLSDFLESWLSVTLLFSNGTEFTHRKTFVGTFSSMATDIYVYPGEYYLRIDIGSAITSIQVIVWDYY